MTTKQSIWMVFILSMNLFLIAGCVFGTPITPTNPSQPTMISTSLPTMNTMILHTELVIPQGPVYSLAWSPDGSRLATTGYKQLRIWDGQTFTELIGLDAFTAYVWGVAWSPDGSAIASASRDGKVRVWDSTTYQLLASLPAGDAFCVSWSPDGKLLVSGTSSGEVTVWDPESGEVVQKWQENSLIISVVWSPEGGMIASGQWDGQISLYDPKTGELLVLAAGSTSTRNDVNGLAWSPDGLSLASAHQDGNIRLWDVQNNQFLRVTHSHAGWVRGLDWSPDGSMLASAGDDGMVRIWDPGDGTLLTSAEIESSALWSIAWAPDGRQVAIGSGTYDSPDQEGKISILSLP